MKVFYKRCSFEFLVLVIMPPKMNWMTKPLQPQELPPKPIWRIVEHVNYVPKIARVISLGISERIWLVEHSAYIIITEF